MGQIDLTPSPEAYLQMLRIIAEESTQHSHRVWAKNQLKLLGVEEE
jgi:hypothetical protein